MPTMKNAKKLLFTLVAFLAVTGGVFAQAYLEDEKWGRDPEHRKHNVLIFNHFRDNAEMKNYDLALQYMHELIENAPKSHENIYIRGGNIYKAKITQSKTLKDRGLYTDSLMYIYDKRIEFFGTDEAKRAQLLTLKASDYLAYKTMDRENVRRLFNEAIDAGAGKDAQVLNTYFNVLVEDYKADMVETDTIMEEYDRLGKLMKDSNDAEEGQKVLESLLLTSGAADCENLEKIYRPQYEADPNNVELMTKIVGMMSRGKCENEFQLNVAENLYKVSPTPETGLALAMIFEARGEYEKSSFYWQESINNEPDPKKKVDYTMRAAASALALENYRQAVTFARETLEIDPENGLAYMIIGQSYGMTVSTSCSDNFSRSAAFWLVVDNLQKARNLLSGDQNQVDVLTRQINSYSGMFPSNEECFFRSLNNGDSYTVNCGWISGRTIVRVGR